MREHFNDLSPHSVYGPCIECGRVIVCFV